MLMAANEADFNDPNCLDEASGQQWGRVRQDGTRRPVMIPDLHSGNKLPFYIAHNGGLIFRHRAEFYEGDRLVRFASQMDRSGRVLTTDELLNSPWWMNDARFVDLMNRARTAGVGVVEMARRQLAIPEDWSTCEQLIVAQPLVLLAAYAGPGRTADAGDERRVIATEAAGLWIDQLYIPGLGQKPWRGPPKPGDPPRINRALGWLRFERARQTVEVERSNKL
jgi:hypothetical protein